MESAPILFNNAWMGSYIKKAHLTVISGAVGLICLDIILEIRLLPFFYRGIPVPFMETGKPIGAALIPAVFFSVLLIAANVFGFAYLLRKAGYDLGLIPKTKNDWIDAICFFIFLVSGMAMWYLPIFFLSLLITGLYLVVGQLT